MSFKILHGKLPLLMAGLYACFTGKNNHLIARTSKNIVTRMQKFGLIAFVLLAGLIYGVINPQSAELHNLIL